jgi:hypothetical protein
MPARWPSRQHTARLRHRTRTRFLSSSMKSVELSTTTFDWTRLLFVAVRVDDDTSRYGLFVSGRPTGRVSLFSRPRDWFRAARAFAVVVRPLIFVAPCSVRWSIGGRAFVSIPFRSNCRSSCTFTDESLIASDSTFTDETGTCPPMG